MSNKNIEKLGFDYAQNQGTNYPVEEIYRSMIWKQIKEAFIEGFNAALQNKESEVNECYFMPDKKGTSLTICVNCGKEKSLHTIGEGITASKVIYQTTDPSTEQSTYNWQAVGDKDKFLDEVRGKESDVSTEEIELESQRRYTILERYNNIDSFMKREAFKNGVKWYVSIVNNKEDIPVDFKEVTGHDSPKEMAAYEKGREDEQKVIMEWIENWEGGRNSGMGALLNKKFLELKERDNVVNDWISVEDRLPDYFKFGGFLVKFKTNMGEEMQCVASFENIPRHNFKNPPRDKRWYVYPSSGHEIKPTHWKPIESQPK